MTREFAMARSARGEQFDPLEVSVFHCINRCVRRCFLCGIDPLTGIDYEHRQVWIEKRLEFLASQFGVDVLGFSVLSNHFHVVLRNRPDVVANWSEDEVAWRWLMLCPIRKQADGAPELPTQKEVNSITGDANRLNEIRTRLSNISWFMRMVSEHVARRSNQEDNVSGRFWQGRFRSVKLCDEAALLACMVYVDLNPIRAGIAETPEESDHTSAQLRIEEQLTASGAADWISPLSVNEQAPPGPRCSVLAKRCSDKGCLPLELADLLGALGLDRATSGHWQVRGDSIELGSNPRETRHRSRKLDDARDALRQTVLSLCR